MTGKKKGLDFSGLDDFNVSDLMGPGKGKGKATDTAKLQMVPLELIHDDPRQSRLVYDPKKIDELAASMKAISPVTGKPRGMKQPLSLRSHPDLPGEYISNGGHRRRRAAAQAGLAEAPAFFDEDADDYDNVVDNLQREGLSPLEMAHFIKKCIDDGDKKGVVAERLGKSASFVSDHIIFFDMADSIRDLYDSELCQSMQALALLHRAYKKHPEAVDQYCASVSDEITTSEVRTFCDSLKTPAPPVELEKPTDLHAKGEGDVQELPGSNTEVEATGTFDSETNGSDYHEEQPELPMGDQSDTEEHASNLISQEDDKDKIKKAILQVEFDGRPARLQTGRRATYGLGWIKYEDDGQEVMVDLKEVALVAVIEG